jgi:demethylmenaquinone methyltransferase/2-methoxy-6-polyprenyl-1,4-benzoquinol methylase
MSYQVTRNFFDELAPHWEELCNPEKLHRIHTIFNTYLSFLKPPILDLGSGTGILIPELCTRFPDKTFFVLEADISLTMLKQAIQNHPANGVQYTQADGHNLPLKRNRFNSIICFQVFPHFQNKQAVMAELQRILKPQGYLAILHLMGHKELNEMHRQAGHAVKEDRIIAAVELAGLLSVYFSIEQVKEQSDLYLIVAKKNDLLIKKL